MNHTRMSGKLALLLLLSASTTCFGMLRSVKKLLRVRNGMYNLRSLRSVQKRLKHNHSNSNKEKLEKKLDRLTNQLKLCTSFRKKIYDGGSATDGGYLWMSVRTITIEHPSVWQPLNEEQVKACCDKCFDEWVKVQEELGQIDREQE